MVSPADAKREAHEKMRSQDFAGAARLLQAAILASPKDPELPLLLSQALYYDPERGGNQRRSLARVQLQSAIALGLHHYSEVPATAVSILFHFLFKEEAEAAVALVLRQDAKASPALRFQKAVFLKRFKGDAAAALEAVNESLAAERQPYALIFRGRLLDAAARFEEARRDLDEAVRLAPADPAPLLARARLLMKLGDPRAAGRDFTAAFALAPDESFELWIEKGEAHLAGREFAAAVEAFTRALALKPESPPAALRRAQARLRDGDRSGALEDLVIADKAAGLRERVAALRVEIGRAPKAPQ